MVTATLIPVWTLELQENLFIHSSLKTLTPHSLNSSQLKVSSVKMRSRLLDAVLHQHVLKTSVIFIYST